MIFFTPFFTTTMIIAAAALFPALFLMLYAAKKARGVKQPKGMRLSLLLYGILAALSALVLEAVADHLFDFSGIDYYSPLYRVVLSFLGVVLVEELLKLLFLCMRTWKFPGLRYSYSGILYAVYVSLGFAVFESIVYVMQQGFDTALPRVILAVPFHFGFAVIQGFFYGRAVRAAQREDERGRNRELILGTALSVLLRAIGCSVALMGGAAAGGIFAAAVLAADILVFVLLRKDGRTGTAN